MDSTERLRQLFQKILQSNLAGLDQEIDKLLRYTLRHDDQADDLRDRVQEVLNVSLERGEEACHWVLDNLRKNPQLFPHILRILDETGAGKTKLNLMVEDLGLSKFQQHKLKLPYVQSLGCDELLEASCHSVKDIPMHFLRHLMALNMQEAFRSFDLYLEASQNHPEQNSSGNVSGSVHPLDVLCCLLHCSDNFLRQEIIRRMSMCQIPVPLLLPAGQDADGTFLLWAMRGITKSHSPTLVDHRASMEDSVVNISLPVFSFVSLGECRSMSIAKIINQILTTNQQRSQNDLVHRVRSWGKMPRYISDGLVEISWYFPAVQKDLKQLEKPFAMTNLHGDLQSNMRQFHFLTKVSSAVFILLEHLTKQQWDLLLHTGGNNTNYYFIVQDQFNQESRQFCSQLSSEFGLNEQNVLMESDEKFNEKLQFILKDTIQKSPKQMTLGEMSVVASELNFCSDENEPGCEYGRLHSLDLNNDIENAKKYNERDVKAQQHRKIQIANIEKELCRLRDQGEHCTVSYKSKLIDEMCHLGVDYNHYNKSEVMTNLQYAFTYMNNVEQQYILKWMQFHKFSTHAASAETVREDVFCKIGQMYEAEVFAGSIAETTRLCTNFPKAAADLLLQGIPLELIDGDTTNIHVQWITDVLTELDAKMEGKCRIRVISIVGVQGTGKSTLLNTMFGLQFPVAHRQCTRGALMSLIKVKEKDLGFDFLVVIDCEGLRALDMASVEESYDHDNELATLVVGLSDIAIVNMALGSTSDMRNILQIVVHALLRMKGTGRKTNCLLVYHKMEGASSEKETMIEDKEMLCLGAQIDKSSKFLQYNDTTECNTLKETWIIPPFELETSCYSEKVVELKRYLLQTIKSEPGSFRDVQTFAGDIKALWNSVKYENYIFRFKNILEGNIYTELYEKFLELEWNLRRKMHRWWVDREARISIQPPGELHTSPLVQHVLRMLNVEERAMKESLQVYFTVNSEDTNSHVAKKFEAEFMEKVESLKSHLETRYTNKCSQMKILNRGLANTIVDDFIREQQDLHETNFDVDLYWNNSVTKYQAMIPNRHNVEEEFLQLLRRDMRTKGSLVSELIQSISRLSDFAKTTFTYDAKYVNDSWFFGKCNHMENCLACNDKRNNVSKFLLEKASKYVQRIVNSDTAYDPVHGMELLNMVNEVTREDTALYTALFTLHLKLQILANTAPYFQKTHDNFFSKCRAEFSVAHQGAEAINYLRSVLNIKRFVKNYCQDCLKPAVKVKVQKILKQKLFNDYTNFMCAVIQQRASSSEGSHGLTCRHHAPAQDTLENIIIRYTNQKEIPILVTNIISSVIGDIRKVLNPPDVAKRRSVMDLVAAVWTVLEEGIPGIRDAPFNDPSLNVREFSSYFDFFVKELEKQIQKEFNSNGIEEHYTECPYLGH
ncbi:up-regulator of cell proliferation-like [Rhinoderma darwinii]|uniref:up-regulator of cell proliferation-like n=1 Tax=Rhinoderma darwinii TaxID=43563 RepID=UPI003F67ABA2